MGIRGSKGLRRALVAVAVACATGVGVGSAQGAASCTVGSTCTVASEADLIAAIQAVDGTGPGASSPTTISFSADITLTSALPIINGPVTISGNGHTLDGGGSYRGFLLYNSGDTNGSGTPIQAAISDLTISNAVATGGAGGQGGGGGAGLGGAIFVAAGVHLITDQVTLTGDGAVGGKGGGVVPASDYDAGGGGGGMGGNGGALNGGGGGLGLGANGGSNGGGGSQGIAATLSAGGTSASGAAGGSYGGGGGAGVAGSNDSGGGGGIGGTGGYPGKSGGGFGGGGGFSTGTGYGWGGFGGGGASFCATYNGAHAGFGGGAPPSTGGFGRTDQNDGGVGGFGGGSGAGTGCNSGTAAYGGGGGAGLGGAVFVQQYGSITFTGALDENGGTVTGGTGGSGSGNGSAFGSAVFLQGVETTAQFSPGSGQTQTVTDGIADEYQNGGGNAAQLRLDGPGTLVLQGTNKYTYTYVSDTLKSGYSCSSTCTLDLQGSLTTTQSSGIKVGLNGMLNVTGSINGNVTVNSGGTLHEFGPISGKVTLNTGGTLCDPVAPSGGVTNNGGTITHSCTGPPKATISSPANDGSYSLNQVVATSFSCQEGTKGPGLASCTDSNGVTGTTGTLTGRLNTSAVGTHTYKVTAKSKDGLTSSSSITYKVHVPCVSDVTFQLTHVEPRGSACIVKQGGTYTSTGPLRINGVPLPSLGGGAHYVITPPSKAHPGGMFGVDSGGTPKDVKIGFGGFNVYNGTISWKLPADNGKHLGTVATLTLPGGQYLKGMPLTGSVSMQFGKTSKGTYYATFPLSVQLPSIFKAGPTASSGGVSGKAAVRVDDSGVHFDGIHIEIHGAYIGALQVKSACFAYLPGGSSGTVAGCPAPALPGSPLKALTCTAGGGSAWSGSADIVLPVPSSPELSVYGGFSNGTVTGLSVAASGLKVPIAEDVFLSSVGVQLCLPNAHEGFSIAGAVGVSAMPVGSKYALTIAGAFAYHQAFGNTPWSLSLGGTLAVYGKRIGSGQMTFGGAPVVTFSVSAGVNFSIASVNGKLAGFFETASPYHFSVAGNVHLCLKGIGCFTGQAAASSKGISGCAGVGTVHWWSLEKNSNWKWYAPWRVHSVEHSYTIEAGFGYYWHGSLSLWGSSCYIGNYEIATGAAASGDFVVPHGVSALAVRIRGVGGAPHVKIITPGGRVIQPPSKTGEKVKGIGMVVEDSKHDATSLMLVHPQAGRWRVRPVSGSVAVSGIKTARALPPPVVSGAAKRLANGRVGLGIAYALPSGEKLSLYVRGPHGQNQVLGAAKGKPCKANQALKGALSGSVCRKLSFKPAYGRNGVRTVYGLVTRGHGLVVKRIRIARVHVKFRTPKAPKVKLTRRHGHAHVSFRAVPHTAHYAVGVSVSDGRKLSITTKRTSLSVRHVGPESRIKVSVWPVFSDGVTGKAGKAALKPKLICRKPTGRISAGGLAKVKLGLTRHQLGEVYPYGITTSHGVAKACLHHGGIHVGFGGKTQLRKVSAKVRRALRGRVVIALTSNHHYRVDRVRPGARISRVAKRLKLGRVIRIGGTRWYGLRYHSSEAILAVVHGVVRQVGIADRRVARKRSQRSRLLHSFRRGLL